ncbi:MAG TPA: hypothetical protein VEJ46_04535 [Candidatus Acidoferrum sp.]|nr:hypothetical protein [Candidatus Acidoferrum sp.]
MAMFDFGERKKIIDSKGAEKETGEVALHVQCAWRIASSDRIIVGSRDLQYPADYSEDREVPDEFDWDRHPNRQDKLVRLLFADGTKQFMVQNIEVGAVGRFRAVLSGELSLELFPDDSLPLEHWRLFLPHVHQPHLVVTGRDSRDLDHEPD